jgi:hypothetical protein
MGQTCIGAGALRAADEAEVACDCATAALPLSSGRDLLAMVSCPKSIRTHCKKCKIHQEHKVPPAPRAPLPPPRGLTPPRGGARR